MPRPWEPEGAWAPYTDVDTEGHRFYQNKSLLLPSLL